MAVQFCNGVCNETVSSAMEEDCTVNLVMLVSC